MWNSCVTKELKNVDILILEQYCMPFYVMYSNYFDVYYRSSIIVYFVISTV